VWRIPDSNRSPLASHAMDIVYNIADAINKIGFGLVIYVLSRSSED